MNRELTRREKILLLVLIVVVLVAGYCKRSSSPSTIRSPAIG